MSKQNVNLDDTFGDGEVTYRDLVNFVEWHGGPASEPDLQIACDWLHQHRVDAGLISLLHGGKLRWGIKEGEMAFRTIGPDA